MKCDFYLDQRNHVGCCIRSGVTAWCEPLCGSSQKPEHLDRDYTQCMAQGFQIMSCFNFGQGMSTGVGEGVGIGNFLV